MNKFKIGDIVRVDISHIKGINGKIGMIHSFVVAGAYYRVIIPGYDKPVSLLENELTLCGEESVKFKIGELVLNKDESSPFFNKFVTITNIKYGNNNESVYTCRNYNNNVGYFYERDLIKT